MEGQNSKIMCAIELLYVLYTTNKAGMNEKGLLLPRSRQDGGSSFSSNLDVPIGGESMGYGLLRQIQGEWRWE